MKRVIFLLLIMLFCYVAMAEVNTRSYSAPKPKVPPTRAMDNIKGPVKSYFSQSETFPFYFSSREYSKDGILIYSSAGRTSMSSEVRYVYDDRGFVAKVQETEYGNGMEYPYDPIVYRYVFDDLGYPIRIDQLSPVGDIINSEIYTYSDTTYTVESETEPSEYYPGYSYKTFYNSQGKLVSRVITNLSDGTIERTEYAYIPAQNITIEYSNWAEGSYSGKRVTKYNDQSLALEASSYDGDDKLLNKQTFTYDAYGNELNSVWIDTVENITTRSTTKYTYDRYGNPLTSVTHTDGEEDETSNCSYEYF